jgi:hypothetical protein
MRKIHAVGASLALAAGVLGGSAAPSLAAQQPRVGHCPQGDVYSYIKTHNTNKDMVSSAYGAPGQHVSITITKGLTVGSTITGQVEGDISAIIAGAKASISESIARSITTTVSYTGGTTIKKSWKNGGYEHAGAHRKATIWRYGYFTGQCKWHTIRKGTAKMPYHIPAFWATKA